MACKHGMKGGECNCQPGGCDGNQSRTRGWRDLFIGIKVEVDHQMPPNAIGVRQGNSNCVIIDEVAEVPANLLEIVNGLPDMNELELRNALREVNIRLDGIREILTARKDVTLGVAIMLADKAQSTIRNALAVKGSDA